MAEELTNLEQMLDVIDKAAEGIERVSLEEILKAVGRRSFGPLLLLIGAILASPLSGIPGLPTIMGLLVLLIAVQLLFRRDHFWLPRWLLRRSVEQGKVSKSTGWLHRPARFVDRLLRPRLTVLVQGASAYLIAIICLLLAAGMPAMEFFPFSASGAGASRRLRPLPDRPRRGPGAPRLSLHHHDPRLGGVEAAMSTANLFPARAAEARCRTS